MVNSIKNATSNIQKLTIITQANRALKTYVMEKNNPFKPRQQRIRT